MCTDKTLVATCMGCMGISRPLLFRSQDLQSTAYPIQCPVRRAEMSYSTAGHIQCRFVLEWKVCVWLPN